MGVIGARAKPMYEVEVTPSSFFSKVRAPTLEKHRAVSPSTAFITHLCARLNAPSLLNRAWSDCLIE